VSFVADLALQHDAIHEFRIFLLQIYQMLNRINGICRAQKITASRCHHEINTALTSFILLNFINIMLLVG